MTQQHTVGRSSYEVRDDLESLLERDLLGPWDGPQEELAPGVIPAERYFVGRLVPRVPDDGGSRPESADDADFAEVDLLDEVAVLDDEPDDAAAPEATRRTGTMASTSLGMSFVVPADVDRLAVEVSWGRYQRVPSEVHETEQGRPRTVWKRTPGGGAVEVDLAQPEGTAAPDPTAEGAVLTWRVLERDLGRAQVRVVHLALVNGLPVLRTTPDLNRLYQAGFCVTALDGHAAVFLGHNDPDAVDPAPSGDDERAHLELLHRRSRRFATGHHCAVDGEQRDGERRAWRLSTTTFPAADVLPVVPGDVKQMPGVELDMNRLGNPELAADDLVAGLTPLVTGYRTWLAQQRHRVEHPEGDDLEIEGFARVAAGALDDADEVADRLERAVELLRTDGLAREAFRFANQAMARQRVRSELVRRRVADPSLPVAELLRRLDVPENRSWRPFQLAFVLLCVPGLTDPAHPDAQRGADDGTVQLLFFPTGGGKTEAYLGLTAYTFAIRRLQGVVGDGPDARDGSDGVAVLMRYTLRLLTAQQFQRAAALVCACEWLRRERIAGGDQRWGTTPFRLGLWVGSSVAPNTYEEAKRQVADAVDSGAATGGVLQLVACPWCGSVLSAGRDVRTDDLRRRVLVFCSDEDGRCPFTPARSPGEGLPVVTVDEEVYRLTPALVISTVDKFAQLPWKGATATLFGLVGTRCPRHGWQLADNPGWCRQRHQAGGGLPASEAHPVLRLRPPDLVIQDELHLISDALGSIVGLFETVVDRLASRTADGGLVRPVLVASTATVRRARDQVLQVFARRLTVFPPQVLDAGETFFSRRIEPTPDNPGRRYRGICAPGERMTAATIRVMSALMEHSQHLFDRHGKAADPYQTLVGYFTSTRQLASTRRLVDDDIAGRLARRDAATRRRRPLVTELTSRMPSGRIATTLGELEREFDPAADTTAALDAFRAMTAEERAASVPQGRAVDVLLATSMLQVGVDVPRLGLMLVHGQPKNTAEYIQATSRVGRDRRRPGLVLTLFHWSRPRDLAHYESFGYDHATFGMRVEGVTTTPFSDRALDRGLSAVIAAAIRHSSQDALPNTAAHVVDLAGPVAGDLVAALARRVSEVTHDQDWAIEAERQAQHRLDSWSDRRRRLPEGQLGFQRSDGVTALLVEPGRGPWEEWSAPMSLREVEPEILLQLDGTDLSLGQAPAWDYVQTEEQ